jgi:cyclin B
VEGNLKPAANYMDNQVHINAKMRAILVDWLVEVHLKFKLSTETLYLMINLIDRFLAKKMVARQRLQLVGVTCMLLASKYEEIYFPEVRDFVYITDRAYTRTQILQMETVILNTLKFEMTVPTAQKFLTRFAKVATLDKQTELTAAYICERTLQEHSMLQYLPSEIAATSVSMALRNAGHRAWNTTLAAYTGYAVDDLAACMADTRAMMKETERHDASLRAVKKKYKSEKYGSVAATALRM